MRPQQRRCTTQDPGKPLYIATKFWIFTIIIGAQVSFKHTTGLKSKCECIMYHKHTRQYMTKIIENEWIVKHCSLLDKNYIHHACDKTPSYNHHTHSQCLPNHPKLHVYLYILKYTDMILNI